MVQRVRPSSQSTEESGPENVIERLERELAIDQDAMEDMCSSQPDMFYRVAKALALQISKRDEAKQLLQEAEAKADQEAREAAGDDKVTEKQIASDVRMNGKVLRAMDVLNAEARAVGQLSALKEAFQQRSYMLNNMTELYITGYFGQNVGSGSRNKIRDRNADEAKSGMARLRREFNERKRD